MKKYSVISDQYSESGTQVSGLPQGCRHEVGQLRFARLRSQLLAGVAALSMVSAVTAATFDAQYNAMKATTVNQPESAIQSLLKAGLDEGKAVLAISEAQKWLRQNQAQDSMTLYYAARAAEWSGDLKGAVSLYQQYLKKADLKSDLADEAVYAVYTILIDGLNDTAAAYAFSKNEGARLLVCPRAKQFDEWFLDQAVGRNDAAAVARRLEAATKAGYPDDLLIARYDNYFRWIVKQVKGSIGFTRDGKMTQAAFEAYRDLLDVMTVGEELKLQIDWSISVRKYVQAKAGKEEAPPPIAEAKALLSKYPRNASLVFIGWAGGTKDNHANHVGDTSLYWNEDIDAKMTPIIDALKRLPASDQSRVYASMVSGWREPNRVSLSECKAFQDYVAANPHLMQGKLLGSQLTKHWGNYTPEEAQKLAPSMELNRHPDASMIRAISAGGKDRNYDAILAALKGPEAWRLSSRNINGHDVADRLWHYCGRPGGNEKRDKEKNGLAAFVKGREYKVNVKPESPANQRIAEFRKLWADYQSPKPSIPGVYDAVTKVLQFTPEALPELLRDPKPEAQKLARDIIGLRNGMTGPDPMWKELDRWRELDTGSYNPLMMVYVNHERGIQNLKNRFPKKCNPHPLESVLRAAVADGLQKNTLESWQVITWVNTQWPENNEEQVEVARALFNSPAWKTLSFEAQFAVREWFKKAAMTEAQARWIDAGSAGLICKNLMALSKESDIAAAAAALKKVAEGARKSPVKIDIQGLDRLAELKGEVFTDPQVMGLILEVVDSLRHLPTTENERAPFANRICDYVTKQRDPVLVHRTSACLWVYAGRNPRGGIYRGKLKPLTESLLEEFPAAASALARMGIDVLSRSRNIYGFNPSQHVPEMQALLGKAAMKLGLVRIPVARTHPSYPVYKSQADWLTANEDSAWTLLNAADEKGSNWDQLMPVHRKLSVDYLMWVLKRTIFSRDDARMEQVIKPLLDWSKEPGSPWTPLQRLDLDLAYGDIAMQLGQLNNAHKIFVKTQQNPAYANMAERHKATLRRVMVERVGKRFEDALETINELEMEKIPELWADARYARAEVYYDMGEFDDAADDIESILAREPDHGEAKIMQGKVQLKRKKLMEASELDVGSKNAKNTLVPGENLKVTLVDPTLAVSGAGTEVEVSVWTTSGDKEHFFLRQFGDQKTKFRGEVRTALGAPNVDDNVLQVIGDDEIWYAYSERFRRKMNNMEEERGGPITVRSDAVLMASARKLLSEAEQRVADMEAKMAQIARGRHKITSATEAQAQAEAAREAARKSATREDRARSESQEKADLSKQLLRDRVKPGKAINVRVIDPDASRTPGIDEVAVSIESSSGDSIGRVVLKETGTHTGWFEGSIPTDGAQAMAFAQNTEPGRNPNMVISPKTDYPAWRPVSAGGAKPEFKIDLNDNVPVGDMSIIAQETGAKLKKFVLQTGMNAREMTTIAAFPTDIVSLERPWHPSVTVMNDTDHHHNRDERSVYDLSEIRHHLERGWMTQQYQAGVSENVAGPSAAMTSSIPAKVQWRRQNRHHNSHVIYRFRAYFHEPADVTRRFKVQLGKWTPPKVHGSVSHPAQYTMTVDGRRITEVLEKHPAAGAPVTMEGELNLREGIHTLEIWATGWDCRIGFGRSVMVLANLNDPEQLSECPDSFFDPETFPKGVLSHRNERANISANGDGTAFNVKFAPGSRARLLNLVLLGQEGTVPAINRISLNQPDGKRVLPVEQDFAELNKNDRLEILTGDKVAVRYVDERFVDKAKEKHERLLHVSFSDASCDFVFFELRKKFDGNVFEEVPYYEDLLRFAHNRPLTLKVSDPDMDMTDKPDSISVTLESRSGGRKKFTAKETEDSSGIFQLKLIPVPGAPASPSEFQVGKGENVYAIYRDEENISPGVPVDRLSSVEHAVYRTPQLRVSHAEVEPLDFDKFDPDSPDRSVHPPAKRGLSIGFASREERLAEERAVRARGSQGLLRDDSRLRVDTGGLVQPAWSLRYSWGDPARPPQGGIRAVHGREMAFEVEAPHLALRSGSTVAVFLQTEAGRQQGDLLGGSLDGNAGAGGAFDITVPGTIRINARLAGPQAIGGFAMGAEVPLIPLYVGEGYHGVPGLATSDRVHGGQYWARSKNIFGCRIPLIADFLPEEGILPPDEIERRREAKIPVPPQHALVVKPGDTVYVGVRYEDQSGQEKWLTGSAKVVTHPVLDIMDEDYREDRTTAYVGEALNIRVVDLGADVSDESDTVKVVMRARSGALYPFELLEVDNHSGVFRGTCELTYVKKNASTNQANYSVKEEGFPVVYGDAMAVGYTDDLKQKARTRGLIIQKGADGMVNPFSKKYDDPKIAQRTQFSLAEAYLEMAKRHRKLGETELAEDEYARAKDMLEKAMEMFRDPGTRAQAEYLLGNLTQEEADTTDPTQAELREDRYRAALSRYLRVTGSYPDTLPASKAQFKIATVYERLNEPEIAAQEYVKLAYKYPDSEFLALSMARLGTHFQKKASAYEKKAKELLAKGETGDKDAEFDGKAMEKMYIKEYIKSAEIFARLQERFPDHELAGQGGLKAGQAYMRAQATREALIAFKRVFEHESYDGPKIRAQAMYWAGLCYEALKEEMAAYSIYKRLTYDFPESEWASFARSQLSSERLLNIEVDIEEKRIEEGR